MSIFIYFGPIYTKDLIYYWKENFSIKFYTRN